MGVKDALGENKKFLLLVLLLVVVMVLVGYSFKFNSTNTLLGLNRQTYSAPKEVLDTQYDYSIVITTTYGSISIDLYENLAPENVNSLLFLIGERYYEGLTFHQVIKDFKIQGGDSKGDGTGDPGYSVKKENLISFKDYDIGMANASQFFIVLPNSHKKSFDGEYSVIGKVTEGFAVIDSIAKVEVSKDYKPVNDIVIKNILIQEN
ncbi:MAG TPA: peptidylprolyl isomerase [Candidatus Dojkabacteria bacterium]|nr:peptidylprolyl isomerase [Candidatus Dojkabacteria bacterium]